MALVNEFIVFFILLLIISTLYFGGYIKLKRDFLFIVFIGQSLIYNHIMPTKYVYENLSLTIQIQPYITLQYFVLIFYEIPLILIYFFKIRNKKINTRISFEVNKKNSLLYNSFILFCLIIPFGFLYVSITNFLFFTRIGHGALFELTQKLSSIEFLIYRIYKELGLFLSILILILKTNSDSHKLLKITLLSNVLIYGSFVLVNNRLQSIILILILSFTYIIFTNTKIKFKTLGLVLIAVFYSITIVTNFRDSFSENNGKPKISQVINPFYDSNETNDPLYNRLNGLYFMASAFDKIDSKGYALFKPFNHSIKMFFGSFYNSEYYSKAKSNLLTNSRSITGVHFFGFALIDIYQTHLSELFLSFGVVGFFLGSIIMANLFVYVTRNIFEPKSIFKFLIGILMMYYILQFEKDFIFILFGGLKMIPILIILSIFLNIKKT